MSKKVSLVTFILSIILAVILVFMLTFTLLSEHYREKLAKAYGEDVSGVDGATDGIENGDNAYSSKIELVEDIFDTYSYFDLDKEAITDGMLKGLAAGTGDKYAEYYTVEEFSLLQEDNSGEMQGIGINIIYNADYKVIEVINVMPDSPALEAGVMPGDLIVAVGSGEDAKDVSELGYYPSVALLQGKAGTVCEFTALRGKNYEETLVFSIERNFVTVQTVTYHTYEADKSIGIIRIFEFDANTPDQFVQALDALAAEGATKFVFDVRNNPGGDLNSICQVLDFIVPEGPIIRMRDKSGYETLRESGGEEFDAPMVVLCNGNTASAAELFTIVLMDYEKAVSIGDVTYGKGSVQTLLPLSDGSGVKLTTRMYFPPYSEGYDGIGITPDIEIEMEESLKNVNLFKISDKEDTQLQRAVKYLAENN